MDKYDVCILCLYYLFHTDSSAIICVLFNSAFPAE
jgi:hypothetical protein